VAGAEPTADAAIPDEEAQRAQEATAAAASSSDIGMDGELQQQLEPKLPATATDDDSDGGGGGGLAAMARRHGLRWAVSLMRGGDGVSIEAFPSPEAAARAAAQEKALVPTSTDDGGGGEDPAAAAAAYSYEVYE
jgi:hypothetical protein